MPEEETTKQCFTAFNMVLVFSLSQDKSNMTLKGGEVIL